MNLSEIKSNLGVETLPLTRALDSETKAKQPFLIFWDDNKRQRVIIHDDTMAVINTPNINLQLSKKELTSKESGKAYTQIAIFVAADVEIVL